MAKKKITGIQYARCDRVNGRYECELKKEFTDTKKHTVIVDNVATADPVLVSLHDETFSFASKVPLTCNTSTTRNITYLVCLRKR